MGGNDDGDDDGDGYDAQGMARCGVLRCDGEAVCVETENQNFDSFMEKIC